MAAYKAGTTYRIKVSYARTLTNEGVVEVTTPDDFSGNDLAFGDLVDEAIDAADINAWPMITSDDTYDILSEEEVSG